MKKLFFLIILVVTQSASAQPKETWETSFTPPSRGNQSFSRGMPPEDIRVLIILNIEKNTDGVFVGELQFTGAVRCRGIAKIESGKIAGDLVSFKTEPLPVMQCPPVTFSGKVVGDTWVGILPWNGKDNELVFKKK